MENAASERLSRQGRFDLLDDGVEAGRIVNGHFGQRLAIQTDFGLAETVDEFAVAEASRQAALMRMIHSLRNSRLRTRRSRNA